jgi:ribonuclease P protein component
VVSGTGERFRPRERLTTPAEFRRVFRDGVRVDGPLFLLVAAGGRGRRSRLGLAAGRRLGAAVQRNRAKRLLRESFRRSKACMPETLDLVLIPKSDIQEKTLFEVEREYRERLRRLAARLATRRRSPPSAPGN